MELLAPSGSFEQMMIAVNSGADAVYLGYTLFNARMKAKNFDIDSLKKAVEYCHLRFVKVYVTVNTCIKEQELPLLINMLNDLSEINVDALIVTDLAAFFIAKSLGFETHVSTQAGVHNKYGALFFEKIGAKRLILSRECTFKDIKDIKTNSSLSLEVFAHGALCVSFSGNCLLSSYQNGNSGNRGLCLQCCRNDFSCTLDGNTAEGHLLSANDLIYIDKLAMLSALHVDSIKIEGRLKRDLYIALVVNEYRKALDSKKYDLNNLLLAYNRNYYEQKNLTIKSCGYENGLKVINSKNENHIGLYCGKVISSKKIKGYYFGEVQVDGYTPKKMDGVKFFYDKKEVGGLTLSSVEPKGKNIYKIPLVENAKQGSSVYVTDSKALLTEKTASVKKIAVEISLFVNEENKFEMSATCKSFYVSVMVDAPLEKSLNGFSYQSIEKTLQKAGDLPFSITVKCIDVKESFIPLSVLNSSRRELLDKLKEKILKRDKQKTYNFMAEKPKVRSKGISVIEVNEDTVFSKFITQANAIVLTPKNYAEANLRLLIEEYLKKGKKLYLKLWLAFCNDITYLDTSILQLLKEYGIGIYADNYFAVEYARENSLSYIAGSFLNVYNSISYACFNDADYVVLSSELSGNEAKELLNIGACYYAYGNKPLAITKACPFINHFNSDCGNCKYKDGVSFYDKKYSYPISRIKIKGCYFVIKNGVTTNLIDKLNKYSYNSYIDLTEVVSVENYTLSHWEKGVK